MAEFAALPLFTDSWIADTAHLTRHERGLYFDLLVLMWRTPGCRVPQDIEWTMRRLRCDESERAMLVSIFAEFCTCDGNWRTQKRLQKEFEYVRLHSRKQSESAKARWNKEKNNATAYAKQMPEHDPRHTSGNAPTPTPTPTPTVEKNLLTEVPKETGKRGSRVPADFMPDTSCQMLAEELLLTTTESQTAYDNFMDYWRSVPGSKGLKLDWQATFRNWLRRFAADLRRKPNGTNQPKPSRRDNLAKVDAAIAELERREAEGSA